MPELLLDLLTLALTVAAVIGALFLVGRIYSDSAMAHDEHHRFKRQLLQTLIGVGGAVLVIIELPISDATRGQLLGLLGLVISAIIALASSSIVANGMAGIMLRTVRNFRPGDFVRIHDHFGRVTERGLFHTEIQTQDRDLTTLPNLYLVTNPTTVVHADGTIISATVSLGYDVHHSVARDALLKAVERAELSDGFVRTTDLLDHVVVYRAAGFLAESKTLLLARSRLREAMIDCLHEAGIEIASPAFVNYRRMGSEAVAPERKLVGQLAGDTAPDELIFDKAEKAEKIEDLKAMRESIKAELDSFSPGAGSDEKAIARVEALERKLARLDQVIARRSETKNG